MTPGFGEPSWRDQNDRAVEAPSVPGPDAPAFYRELGEFQGQDYARNAFAAGTVEEAETLRDLLTLGPGTRVLDVGCADARHLRHLAATGIAGTGIDIAPALIAAGRSAAAAAGITLRLEVLDARLLDTELGAERGTYDVAWSLCQGALGTSPATDPTVLAGLAAAVRPGGAVVFTCFHAQFAARHLAPGDAFDTLGLVHHQVSELRGPDHARQRFDLWTASYTAREARRLAEDAGLEVLGIRGVEPGSYGRRRPGEVGLDDPELLVHARRPGP
jgi:SAM-dependent methyltransferase